MLPPPQKFPTIKPQTEAEKLLMEFVIYMENEKNPKVNNPHLIVRNIWKWVKPINTKFLKLICNLIRHSPNDINQYEAPEKFDEFITKQLHSDNWDKIENTVDLKEIRSRIVNSERSLDLLSLYQEILEGNNIAVDLENTATNTLEKIRRENYQTLIDLELIILDKGRLKIANKVYETAFDSKLINQELSAIISTLVNNSWESSLDIKGEKEKVIEQILNDLPKLAKKTDNLARIIEKILLYGKFEPLLVESLLKLACQDNLILVGKEGDKSFQGLIKKHLIENWQTKIRSEQKSAIFERYELIQDQLINNKNCDSFWLLVTYQDILQGKEILFQNGEEEKELFRLKLVEQDSQSSQKLKVVNSIYKSVFNKNWVSDQLQEIQEPLYKNLLAWLDTDNFQSHITTLKEKFPENLKKVMEEIIRWTDNDLNITEKIVDFIKVNISEVKSENVEWFSEKIILSSFLGTEQEQKKNHLMKEDFEILMGNMVNNSGIKVDKLQMTSVLLPLTDKFKQNPLIIIDELLSLTENEQNYTLINNLVDLILQDTSIIRTEADVGKIPDLLQQIKTQKNNKVEEFNMQSNETPNKKEKFDDLLNRIVEQEDGIEAIVIFNIKRKLAQHHNSNLKLTNSELYDILFKNRGASKALINFHLLENLPKAIDTFGKETNTGKLNYAIFCLSQGIMVAYITPFEGQSFAICYITTDASLLASTIIAAEETIKTVKKRLEEGFAKYEDN